MFFAKIAKIRRTLAFGLTLWYAGIFVLSAGITFVLIYWALHSTIRQRIDDDLLVQANELSTVYALQGKDVLQRTLFLQAQAAGERRMFYRLFYPSGLVFASSNMSYWKDIGIDRKAVEEILRGRHHVYRSDAMPSKAFPIRMIYTRIGNAFVLQLGNSLQKENQLLGTFKKIFMLTMSAMWLLAVGVGWFMSRRALSGVASVTRTASKISEQDLETRVPVGQHHYEIEQLSRTFNQMLDRIQRLVTGVTQMNDNIAHDLRSPITRIRGLAEVTLTNASDMENFRHMAASTIEECDRLLSMINTMLTISRTEAGVDPSRRSPVAFSDLVRHACELFRANAEDKNIDMDFQTHEDLHVIGDAGMLQRMVANLIDNALKYTADGGRVTVRLVREGEQLVLTVADTGVGIASADQSRVFSRFFRGDQSRSQGGAGLGLSLARAIARAHSGDILLQSEPDQGSIFTVLLPSIQP